MAFSTPQVLRAVSFLVSIAIVLGIGIYSFYTFKHHDSNLPRWRVIVNLIISCIMIIFNPSSTSFYLLILTLVFNVQAFILAIIYLSLYEILWLNQTFLFIIGKIILELIIRKYEPSLADYGDTDHSIVIHKLNSEKIKFRIMAFISLIYTIAYLEMILLITVDEIFTKQKTDIPYVIFLFILLIVQLYLLNVILYNRSTSFFLTLLVIASTSLCFYLTGHYKNFAALMVYFSILTIIYIQRLCKKGCKQGTPV